MKFLILSLAIIMLTACSNRAVYDMLHEKARQDCLKQGRSDCHRDESYDKYKQKRDEVMHPQDIY